MNNFFGLNSGSSEYDSRRHVNLIYYTYFQYRVLAGGDDFLRSFAPIFQSQDERRIVDHTVNNILGNYEYSFLVYLKNRYNLSNIEFDKILSGITHYDEMVKSPAGYSVKENWILVIHLLYAQLAVKPELHKFDIQIQLNFIVKLAQGMRGCTFDKSKWQLVGISLNECLDKGWRNFADLPKIEQYVLSKIGEE